MSTGARRSTSKGSSCRPSATAPGAAVAGDARADRARYGRARDPRGLGVPLHPFRHSRCPFRIGPGQRPNLRHGLQQVPGAQLLTSVKGKAVFSPASVGMSPDCWARSQRSSTPSSLRPDYQIGDGDSRILDARAAELRPMLGYRPGGRRDGTGKTPVTSPPPASSDRSGS